MKLLLDTCAFLWLVGQPDQLSQRARELILHQRTLLLLSAASAWEIAIKTAVGQLAFREPIAHFVPYQMAQNTIDALPIAHAHALHVAELPLHHRDPFDRLLAAQSLIEGLPILSPDPAFDRYGVERIWG